MYLLVTLALLAQDNAAEETFKKIEESLEKAKTVSITFKSEGSGKRKGAEQKLEAYGTILLKEGNKAYVASKMIANGEKLEYLLVSDGSKMKGRSDLAPEGKKTDTPASLKSDLSSALVRLGQVPLSFFAWRVAFIAPEAKMVQTDIKKSYRLFDFKAGEDDGNARTLTFKIESGDKTLSREAKIWYDPKSYKLIKRTLTLKRGEGVEGTTTETYEEFSLNADIPDEKFTLPGDK